MSLLVQQPDLGLNGLSPVTGLDPRAAAEGSQSIFYENGLARTPYGYAKLDLSTTGLNSGDIVIGILPFRELDGYNHVIAVTQAKIYDHDRVSSEWDEKQGNAQQSNITSPVSYVEIAHTATETYLDDDTNKGTVGYHLVLCDGGLSNIQRWAGRYETDFANLTGGEDYHTDSSGTTHRALQVGSFASRLILINPQDYNSGVWLQNPQRVRWPQSGYLQNWTGTGSGFSDLIDTGGHNVWSGALGNDYIVYQTKGIWGLNYVGDSDVFRPQVYLPDLGLLSYHLVTTSNNVHYFVGSDYNVYSYYGGTNISRIGDPIHKFLQDELNTSYQYRCWIEMGPENKWLWIFIVPTDQSFITKAYGMNMVTGAWTVRDFANKFGTDEGITAVNLIGAESYTIGETYTTALATLSPYDAADNTSTTAGDTTERYGDVLFEGTAGVLDWSSLSATADYDFSWKAGEVDFSEGGLLFCFSYANDPTKLVDLTIHEDGTNWSGIVIRVDDGSDSDDMPNGSHYYTLTDVCSVLDAGTDYTVTLHVQPCETTGTGVADTSSDTPALGGDTTATLYDPSGETYNDVLETVLVGDRLMIGDATGFVYQFDDTVLTDDGNAIDARHITPVIDWGEPEKYKRWPGISVVVEGTDDGAIYIRHRTGNFDTSETGWTDVSIDLTDEVLEDTVWLNRTSKRIQFEFQEYSETTFKLRSYEVLTPEVQANR